MQRAETDNNRTARAMSPEYKKGEMNPLLIMEELRKLDKNPSTDKFWDVVDMCLNIQPRVELTLESDGFKITAGMTQILVVEKHGRIMCVRTSKAGSGHAMIVESQITDQVRAHEFYTTIVDNLLAA